MKYYSLEFHYYPSPTVNMPGDDDHSREASSALLMAEDVAMAVAKDNNIVMVHGYMWPDGSLYKYVHCALEREAVEQLFNTSAKFDVEGKNEPVTVNISATAREMELEKAQQLSESSLVTLEERFAFARRMTGDDAADDSVRDEHNALYKSRREQLENLPEQLAYRKARDECTSCRPKPGIGCLPCDPCNELFKLSWTARDKFMQTPRPMNAVA